MPPFTSVCCTATAQDYLLLLNVKDWFAPRGVCMRSVAATFFTALAILLCACVWVPTTASAQRAEWGEVPRDAMEMTSFSADSNAAAVVLSDYGRVRVKQNLRLVFERHRRIKLLSEAAYDAWGTVEIPYYAEDDAQEVSDIAGQTFVRGPDGEVVRHELDDDAIFDEDVDGEYRWARFTLPALAPGAVIEYRYEVESAHPIYMPEWSFQSGEPTRWSEFRVTIPEVLDYVTQLQGSEMLSMNESDVTHVQLRFAWDQASTFRSRTSLLRMQAVKRRWVMKDVPALRAEPFMTTPDDYRAMLRFQLARIGLHGQQPLWEMRTWRNVFDELAEADWFGGEIGRHKEVRRKAEALTDGLTDPAEKMKAIYDYVRTTVAWNGGRGYALDHDLDHVLEAKTGSSPELALLLVSMLRDAGLEAHPMLISTRDHGRVIEVYPFLQQFNDVLVHVDLGVGRPRLLSATSRLRPSTLLPPEALNHRGLLLAGDGPAWIDVTAGGKAYQRKAYVQAALDASGAVSGTVSRYDEAYSALDDRTALAEGAPADFVREHLLRGLSGAQVTAQTVAHQDEVNKPLEATATVQVPGYAQVAGDFIYVNPMLIEQRTENPLRRPERSFPRLCVSARRDVRAQHETASGLRRARSA